MAEGHSFPLCVCVCVCVCVFQNQVWPITLSFIVGIENNLAQRIIIGCVANKNYVVRSMVKVTVHI